MKRTLTSWSAAALLLVSACGDSSGKTAPPAGQPAGQPTTPPANSTASKSQDSGKPVRPVRVDMVMAKALFGSEPPVMSPVENPATPEKLALGRMLFDEKSLSKNGDISCASCHVLANYGQDSKPVSDGSGGTKTLRNTPTVWNSARQYHQMWDYRAANVEEQAVVPMIDPNFHGLADEAELVAKMKAKPELVAAFAKAFPGDDSVTVKNFGLAIGAFERTLVTKSKFDEFLDGNTRAFTNEEKVGYNTFVEVGCQTCHMSRLVGGSMPQKLGVFSSYSDTKDTGRHQITGVETDKYFFKVPGLLNVEKTAPYGHDGSVATLEEEVKMMAEIQLQKQLTDEQVASIVTFLKTLTGPLPADITAVK